MRRQILFLGVAAALALAACSDGGAEQTTTAPAPDFFANIEAAEALIDTFYSFDAAAMESALADTDDLPFMGFYQGWAEGANYTVVDRRCEANGPGMVTCPITIEDDIAKTLGYDFEVIDTFQVFVTDGEITSVQTQSNDPEFSDAVAWVRTNLPELVQEPCQGMWNGGPTPQDCAKAMIQGLEEYAAQR
jgi:hypothetical protein